MGKNELSTYYCKRWWLDMVSYRCPTPAVSGKLMPGFVTQKDSRTLVAPLQAFRFDGFRIVQIQCQLKLCKGPCTPVSLGRFL